MDFPRSKKNTFGIFGSQVLFGVLQFGGGFIAITSACLRPGKRVEFGESSSYVVTHPIAATWTAVLGSLEVSVGVVAAEVEVGERRPRGP
ncbi:hypothetical protein F3Y22_tig00116997pilonHSYRG00405 [Hibiscus syriacus]|uniref:Uncharacterized protein n=1 Tax=Hibiscus syriacus TaxID=106335 RepID=A0A6A2WGD8_HIBSY|nr:hypothetical protein F3Y22_tig00116997pilonHSYRG00405 [Hibiscus syriacus]